MNRKVLGVMVFVFGLALTSACSKNLMPPEAASLGGAITESEMTKSPSSSGGAAAADPPGRVSAVTPARAARAHPDAKPRADDDGASACLVADSDPWCAGRAGDLRGAVAGCGDGVGAGQVRVAEPGGR